MDIVSAKYLSDIWFYCMNVLMDDFLLCLFRWKCRTVTTCRSSFTSFCQWHMRWDRKSTNMLWWFIWTCDCFSQFSPDLVLVCAGFDSAIGDPEVLNINEHEARIAPAVPSHPMWHMHPLQWSAGVFLFRVKCVPLQTSLPTSLISWWTLQRAKCVLCWRSVYCYQISSFYICQWASFFVLQCIYVTVCQSAT